MQPRECRETIEAFIRTIGEKFQPSSPSRAVAELGRLESVQCVLRLMAQSDFDGLREYLDEKVVYDWPAAELPFAGHVTGREEVINRIRANLSVIREQRPSVVRVLAKGNAILVRGREKGTTCMGDDYSADVEQCFEFASDEPLRLVQLSFRSLLPKLMSGDPDTSRPSSNGSRTEDT